MIKLPKHIEELTPYKAGKPIEELAREKGLTKIVKLASNENPLGPSPRALEAIRNTLTENRYTAVEIRRVRVQAAASVGSIGQGRLRARHCIAPAMTSMKPATPNTQALCSDSQTICGNIPTKPANAAPAPKETRSAGRAQQISVPPLVNSDTNEAARVCRRPVLPVTESTDVTWRPALSQ